MAIVIVNTYEPDHEVAARLLELAEEKDYDARTVQAQRGEHDANLSFVVPDDVAEEFEKDRAERWPSKIENDTETDAQQPARLNEDAVAADNLRSAQDAAATADEERPMTGDQAAAEALDASQTGTDENATAQTRTRRPGKAPEKPKE
jgi:hypothetical protein